MSGNIQDQSRPFFPHSFKESEIKAGVKTTRSVPLKMKSLTDRQRQFMLGLNTADILKPYPVSTFIAFGSVNTKWKPGLGLQMLTGG